MIRQLHYTSTETGPDGVQGFQVTASTPGIQERHEDLAIQLSAYRSSPGFPLEPSDDDVNRSPVRFGYLPTDEAAILFKSVYVGTDFTGRQGNYFAHSLVLDSGEELGGLLPVELWASSLWARRSPHSRELPALTSLPAGPLADPERIRKFLLGGDRLDRFAVLLEAVQYTLVRQRGRVVMVCPDTDQAAHWIAAVLLSLPRQAAVGLSFTTFSASPTDDEFTLVGTTPDVRIAPRPYDPHVTVDLAAASAAGSGSGRGGSGASPFDDPSGERERVPSPYAVAFAQAWRTSTDDAGGLSQIATRLWSETGLDELDSVGSAWCLAGGRPIEGASLAGAATFAFRYFPPGSAARLWEHVGRAFDEGGPVGDPADWAPLLKLARTAGAPVPPDVEAGYVTAALSYLVLAPKSGNGTTAQTLKRDGLWLPDLRQPHLDATVSSWLRSPSRWLDRRAAGGAPRDSGARAEAVRLAAACVAVAVSASCSPQEQSRIAAAIGPILLDGDANELWTSLSSLAPSSAVLAGVVAIFEARLRSVDGLGKVIEALPSVAVRVLRPATPRSSALDVALGLAAARRGEADKVEALRTIVKRRRRPAPAESVARLVEIVWSASLPTAAEALALLDLIQEVGVGSVAGTALPETLVEIMITDAQSRDGLTDDDGRLASRLYRDDEVVASMSRGAAQIAEAVYFGWYFRERPAPGREAALAAAKAVKMYPRLENSIGGWLLDGVAGWLIRVKDLRFHLEQLEALEAAGGKPFRTAYARRAADRVRTAPPKELALVVAVWFANSRTGAIGLHLMDRVLPTELAGRRRRDVEEITIAFRRSVDELTALSEALDPVWNDDWGRWWEHWRSGHSRSLFGRFRRTSGRN